ncbi:hypothetical protein D3C73_1230580 [compost metagenome]
MPISLAPCFSRATARMARPRSVLRIIQNSTAATASAPKKAMTLGSAIMAGPISTVLSV